MGLSSATLRALNQLPDGVPKGYLRVLSFNEDSVLVDQRTVQLTAAALNNYQTLSTGPLVVQQNGYVSVYVGNESAADVYFDDVTIEHRQGLQVQENQYDPFGLDLAGVSGAAPGLRLKNFYQFNGKERQNDLGLGWSDYGARMYDGQLGRWHSVDPLADLMRRYSTFNYCFDNPIRFIDPDGMGPGDFLNEQGKILGNDGINDGKLYVVKTTQKSVDSGVNVSGIDKKTANSTADFITANSGKSEAFSKNKGIYNNVQEIEGSATNRQAMVDIVSQDNGGGGTSDARNREYGGKIDGNNAVVESPPGPVSDPRYDTEAHITHTESRSDKSFFHSHPSGTFVTGPPSAGGAGSSSTTLGGTTTTDKWRQAPSQPDIDGAGTRTNYEFGRGNGTVYIYNSTGVSATVPVKYFATPKK